MLFSVVSGGYDRPIEGTEANFPLALVFVGYRGGGIASEEILVCAHLALKNGFP